MIHSVAKEKKKSRESTSSFSITRRGKRKKETNRSINVWPWEEKKRGSTEYYVKTFLYHLGGEGKKKRITARVSG